MGYVIIPKPHFQAVKEYTVIVAILTGVICHVAVVAGPTALNHDRRWVIQVNSRARDSAFDRDS